MAIKNLIVCGCSFAHGHHLSPEETWGGYIAKKKNLNFYNIAQGGMGNEWISQKTIGFLENNEHLKQDSLVIIGWSEIGRLMGTFQPTESTLVDFCTIRPQDFTKDFMQINPWLSKDTSTYHGYVLKYMDTLSPFFNNYIYCFFKTYQAIFNLKTYLSANNISFIFFDAISKSKIVSLQKCDQDQLNPHNSLYDMVVEDSYGNPMSIQEPLHDDWLYYLNSNLENKIFTDNWIDFEGSSMLVYMRHPDRYDIFTEGNSGHPNNTACDYFSDVMISKLSHLLD